MLSPVNPEAGEVLGMVPGGYREPVSGRSIRMLLPGDEIFSGCQGPALEVGGEFHPGCYFISGREGLEGDGRQVILAGNPEGAGDREGIIKQGLSIVPGQWEGIGVARIPCRRDAGTSFQGIGGNWVAGGSEDEASPRAIGGLRPGQSISEAKVPDDGTVPGNEGETVSPIGESGFVGKGTSDGQAKTISCLLYTSPSPRDRTRSRMPSSA